MIERGLPRSSPRSKADAVKLFREIQASPRTGVRRVRLWRVIGIEVT